MILFIGLVDYQIYDYLFPASAAVSLVASTSRFLNYDALSIMPLPHQTQRSARFIGAVSSLSMVLSPRSDSPNGVSCGHLQQLSPRGQQKSYLSVRALSYIINVFLTPARTHCSIPILVYLSSLAK